MEEVWLSSKWIKELAIVKSDEIADEARGCLEMRSMLQLNVSAT